ncbi:MAG: hypothetical protein JST00_45600 [Deltaproteobacteria bacterium]|nr:hypothetical protein [Deltaproteobacteria bacterium]
MRHAPRALVLVAVLGLAASGCYSKVTAYDGKFTLGYATAVQYENFVKPIAPGAKLDVVVFANGTVKKMKVTAAKSSRPNVLAVVSAKEETIVLQGVAPGIAEVEVTATDAAGNTLVDKMFFHVARPAKHAIEHSCTEKSEAAYVRGESIDILHDLATSDGRAVVGYDYAPLKAEPPGSLKLVAQPQAWAFYRYEAGAAGTATLRSTVDDKALSLRIVDRAALSEAELHAGEKMLEGGSEYAVGEVHHGSTPLCSQSALTKAKSLTPDVCTVTANLDDEPGVDSNREQVVLVRAHKFGDCRYQMILPELAGGKGIVLEGRTKVGRVQFPGDKASAPTPAPTAPRLFGYEPEAWSRFGGWFFASRLVALAFVLGWLRGRANRATSASVGSASSSSSSASS